MLEAFDPKAMLYIEQLFEQIIEERKSKQVVCIFLYPIKNRKELSHLFSISIEDP